jgi:hypothetical protein
MSDYGKNFGIYNYHKMITDTTANRKFCQCWDNVRNIIDETACLLAQQGIVLDKKKVTDIMAHKYNEKRAVYWYLNKRTEDKKHRTVKEPNKMTLTEYYYQADGTYSIRGKAVEFEDIPEIYEFGNAVVIIDTVAKQVWYMSKVRRLIHTIKRRSSYIGFRLYNNVAKDKNIFYKLA